MRNLLASLLLLGFAISLPAQKSSQGTSVQRAPISDSHEGITIGVDPWTTASRYKPKFPKKSPFSGGVIALHVSFQNDTDLGMRVDLQRIRLLVQISEDNRQELEPLSPDDVADTVLLKYNGKDPTAKRIPLPLPVGKSKPTRDAKWTNFRDDCQNAAVPSKVVGAHSTVEGLIYFNLRGEVDLLQTSRLYIPNLASMGDNQPISYFDIDLGHNSAN
ncbi:MAG TPA: hypothetical protein VEI54_02335 [Candidatus Limnocylindrales bacterium]|nr:hypothetical protein [Candidatus Limnocylindrales bacterium]